MKKEDIKISYTPVWDLMSEKDIKKSTLRKMTQIQIAPNTFTKMSRKYLFRWKFLRGYALFSNVALMI